MAEYKEGSQKSNYIGQASFLPNDRKARQNQFKEKGSL